MSSDRDSSPHPSHGDALDEPPSWKSDFAGLGWKDGDLDWENGLKDVEENQIIQVVKIERCPFVRFFVSFVSQRHCIHILTFLGCAKFFFVFKKNTVTSFRFRAQVSPFVQTCAQAS